MQSFGGQTLASLRIFAAFSSLSVDFRWFSCRKVATGLVGSFAFCYRNMGARESQLLEEEDDWDDLE